VGHPWLPRFLGQRFVLSNLRFRVPHSSPMFAKGAGVDGAPPREIRERPAHPTDPKNLLEGEDPTIRKRNRRKATSTTAPFPDI
jgi:hypothetical protein